MPKVKMIRVLVYREMDHLVAQCLEYDIAAQAKEMDDLRDAFARTFLGQIQRQLELGQKPLENVPKAPRAFWRMFEKKAEEFKRPQTIPIRRNRGRVSSMQAQYAFA